MPKRNAPNSITVKLSINRHDPPYPMLSAIRNRVNRAQFVRWHLAWALDPTGRSMLVPYSEIKTSATLPPGEALGREIRIQISIAPGEPGYRELSELPSMGDSRDFFIKRHLYGAVKAQLALQRTEPAGPMSAAQPSLTPEARIPQANVDVRAPEEVGEGDAEFRDSAGLSFLM